MTLTFADAEANTDGVCPTCGGRQSHDLTITNPQEESVTSALSNRTAFQRINDVIDALDVAEPEHARASAEYLREQLRGTCGWLANTNIVNRANPCLLPAGHDGWHDDGHYSYLHHSETGLTVAPSEVASDSA